MCTKTIAFSIILASYSLVSEHIRGSSGLDLFNALRSKLVYLPVTVSLSLQDSLVTSIILAQRRSEKQESNIKRKHLKDRGGVRTETHPGKQHCSLSPHVSCGAPSGSSDGLARIPSR